MEDVIVNYMKTLPPNKIKQFILYFKGYQLAKNDDQSGMYLVEDSKVTQSDCNKLARAVYAEIHGVVAYDKVISKLEGFVDF